MCVPVLGDYLQEKLYELSINGYGLPKWLRGEESSCQCRRSEFDPWVGKIPWKGNGNPLQYSCLENPMNRGTWVTKVHGITKKSDTT